MTTLIVFSHPNHELAIFGYLQKVRPYLLYLTDGGGETRKEQTRLGLSSIGLLDHASFMDHTEESFYNALIRCDSNFFAAVAEEVRLHVEALSPKEILCDAVEFYNPIHDMSLPVVLAALRGCSGRAVFEVPLIYQEPGGVETYVVQRVPVSRSSGQIDFQLSEQELVNKILARDQIYTILTDQLGDVICKLALAHTRSEVIVPARLSVPKPEPHVFLRYERRAETLAATGEIEHKITYDHHYLSVATSLIQGQQNAP
jgi:hypothetical protein